ncbi:LytTr DNA-binding domain-containing protein [Chitinophaga dinghuensis]|uniref:LytTr DNA-binding domain-containing protein n=1 Tax=Chitinophaga dinghuensis TaxID=1539050 RepID=A0A327VYF6_9BACT|nr:LytTR family DNA-binding domain-containing protein [Chitinophaga dinghuensis]RAJ81999.1 LytTr DNA-binding domain-containing protein [Chitinophaga dinghuensis]
MKTLGISAKNGPIGGWLFQRFTLLDNRSNRIALILFCAVFSFFFMDIFLPFNINTWYEGMNLSLFTILGIFTLCGTLALGTSQFLLFRLKWRKQISHMGYLGWIAMEVILIGAVVTIVNAAINPGIFLTFSEFCSTLPYIALIISIPYSLSLLWFHTRSKVEEVRQLEQHLTTTDIKDTTVHIRDEHDKAVLSLLPEKLLLVKAEDNYVHVFYLAGNTMKKELIRTSLKKVESEIAAFGFNRSHRSYIVNLSRVVLFRKQNKGHFVYLEGLDDMEVPVSGSYLAFFAERFSPAC